MSAPVKVQPLLTFNGDGGKPTLGGVSVYPLDAELAASIGKYTQDGGLLQSVLQVSVARTDAPDDDDLPAVLGRYHISEEALRFIPLFPFERGLAYRATFDARPFGYTDLSDVLTLEFSLPSETNNPTTTVTDIFPSGNSLPENLLRFYVCFSAPMQRGRAEAEIAFLGPDGCAVSDVLYRAPVELWDRSMQRLTVLLDPGRLKRGVGPNRELGPPLVAGQVYTLVIGAGMTDLSGRQLPEPVYKRFIATDAVRERIAVERWEIQPPGTESRQPLILIFPRALDFALLSHTVTIASISGPIRGRVHIDQCERRWSFIPASPWAEGAYEVHIASDLEDICGNNTLAPFDRSLRPADLREPDG